MLTPRDIGLRVLTQMVRVGDSWVGRGLHDIASIEEMHLILDGRAAQVAGGPDLGEGSHGPWH